MTDPMKMPRPSVPAVQGPGRGPLSRTLLQVALFILGAQALFTAARLLALGAEVPPGSPMAAANMEFDNMLRFVGGIWAGVGAALLFCIRRVEDKGPYLRGACAIVFCGGLGRSISILLFGAAATDFVVAAAMEMLATVAVVYWQLRVERTARGTAAGTAPATDRPTAALPHMPQEATVQAPRR